MRACLPDRAGRGVLWSLTIAAPLKDLNHDLGLRRSRSPLRASTEVFASVEAVECHHAAAAVRRAEVMSHRDGISGAVAFYRRGNPDLGEFEEAEILKTFGDGPEDFRGMS